MIERRRSPYRAAADIDHGPAHPHLPDMRVGGVRITHGIPNISDSSDSVRAQQLRAYRRGRGVA